RIGRERGDGPGRKGADHVEIPKRHQRAHINRARPHPRHFVAPAVVEHRWRYLQYKIGTAKQRRSIGPYVYASVAICLIREASIIAGARLDRDRITRVAELAARLWNECHAALAGGRLLGNCDAHGAGSL